MGQPQGYGMWIYLLVLCLAAPTTYASITCLKVGTNATAVWTNAKSQSCSWDGIVGSNFGINPVNKGEYVDDLDRIASESGIWTDESF